MADKSATRRAIVMIGLDDRALARDLDGATRRVRKTGDDIDRIGRRVGKGAAGAGKAKGKGGGFGFGAAAGAGMGAFQSITGMVTGVVGEIYDFEKALVRTQIAAGKSSKEIAQMRAMILRISKDTGVAAGEILGGGQAYIDLTGDVAGAEASMSAFARIAQASGAKVSDVATATAALKESMGLDSKDIEAAFSGLIMQGKAGAVSLADLAGQLSAVAPRFAKFGGSGLLGIADLGAALQIARKGFGSASEAATGLEAMMGALSLNAGKFEASGVKIFKTGKDGKKTFRGFVEIVDSIGRSRLVKDPTALTKAWGSKEAAQAFDMLVANRQELEKIYQAGQDAGAVQRDLGTYLQSSAGKMEASMNRMKVAVAEAMTPERIEKFARAMEKAAGAVEWVADKLDYLDPDTSPLRGKLRYIGADKFDDNNAADVESAAQMGRNIIASGELPGHIEGGKYVKGPKIADLNDAQRKEMADRAAINASDASQQGEYMDEAMYREIERGLRMLRPEQDPWNTRTYGPTQKPHSPEEVKATVDEWSRKLAEVLGAAVADGMSRAKVELKTDSNTTAKTVANAPANRNPPRGR